MERPSSGLRRGKWTQEEEAYVERVIRDFNGGLLDAAPGTTLRSYLSDKLNCDPMRITKKFTGDASIGKRVFHPRENASPAAVERSRREIAELEATWRRKLEQQRREAEAADRKRRAADEPLTVSTGSTRRIRAWNRRGRLCLRRQSMVPVRSANSHVYRRPSRYSSSSSPEVVVPWRGDHYKPLSTEV